MRRLLLIRNESDDTLGIAPECMAGAGLGTVVVDAFDPSADWPGLGDVAGLAVFGGSMNVDQVDEHPYLLRERGFVREAVVDRGLPFLGVCLGGQMLARALGAPVIRSSAVEIGLVPVSLTGEGRSDRVLAALPERASALQWHTDSFELPSGAVHLARGDRVSMQAFRWRDRAWGLQFHPEVTEEELGDWMKAEAGFEARWGRSPDDLRAEIREGLPASQQWGRDLLARFAAVVREDLEA
jgi:GMP synthase-like glutamine amidotransferase